MECVAGHVVDRPRILRHELMEISEVETDLSSEIKCPVQVTLERTSCLVVDTCGDLVDTFCRMCTSK